VKALNRSIVEGLKGWSVGMSPNDAGVADSAVRIG
jgi:hypothetical protein